MCRRVELTEHVRDARLPGEREVIQHSIELSEIFEQGPRLHIVGEQGRLDADLSREVCDLGRYPHRLDAALDLVMLYVEHAAQRLADRDVRAAEGYESVDPNLEPSRRVVQIRHARRLPSDPDTSGLFRTRPSPRSDDPGRRVSERRLVVSRAFSWRVTPPLGQRRLEASPMVNGMESTIVGPEVYAGICAAVTPTDAEVLVAKQVTLAQLDAGRSVTLTHLEQAVLEHFTIPPEGHREEPYDVQPGSVADDVDRDAPQIARQRLRYATKLAIASLVAEGVLTPASSPGNDYLSVAVHRSGTSGGERIPVATPSMAGAYRLTPGREVLAQLPILDVGAFVEGLDGLLDVRARRCLEEALAASRRGLYLSALNLMGAVSEAAWYSVGEALLPTKEELVEPLAENRTALVQHLVAETLGTVKRQRLAVTELSKHAAYLRDLRNYGVHPRGEIDPGQEHAFTEAGCLLVLMETHRYLARLYAAAQAAGANFAGATN